MNAAGHADGQHARPLAGRAAFLDMGRGLAILGVILVHTSQNFPTGIAWLDKGFSLGQFGVQLFFAISAYTMCLTLEQRMNTERRPFLAFWVRRFARLAVPMWFAVLLYLLFAQIGVERFASTSDEPWIIAATLVLVNGLWPTSFSAIVPGGGSIATEALFYLTFPAIFAFRRRIVSLSMLGVAVILLDHAVFRPLFRSWAGASPSTFVDHVDLKQFFHYGLLNQFPMFLVGMFIFSKTCDRSSLTRSELAAIAILLLAYAWGARYLALVAIAARSS